MGLYSSTTPSSRGLSRRLRSAAPAPARLVRGALLAAVAALAPACGEEAAPPAHSNSFFPVRGAQADGTPATRLEWRYRINGGEVRPYAPLPGSTVRFNDQEVTISDGQLYTLASGATIAPEAGQAGISGTTASKTTHHLGAGSPAPVLSTDVDIVSTLALPGELPQRADLDFAYTFEAGMARSLLFDREDLDLLPVGHSESPDAVVAAVTATISPAGQVPETRSGSATLTESWTLLEKLPTVEVMGRSYANVVRVQLQSADSGGVTGRASSATEIMWLAKGVGLLRSEAVFQVGTVSDTGLLELVDTNLVGP